MNDDPKKDYTYEDYLESEEVKPDPTVYKPDTDPNIENLNEYTAGFLNEQHQNLPDSSTGEDLNTDYHNH